ncbi:hypothetical protein C4J81_14085 [Deltaproteobacteria bacterium Smac51]|nr:hypothetical protein C4J81_14085 [Deltaproteobacteria bacterium Smac51]
MKKILNHLEEYIMAVLLPVMCLIIFLNTVGRYTQTFSMPWAEEAARYCMIWLVFLGIAAAARKNSHFAVEVFFLITPKSFHKYIRTIIMLIVLGFTLKISHISIEFIQRLQAMDQVSPSLAIPMWMMYAAIPCGCFLMAIRTVQYFVNNFKTTWDPKAEAAKEFAQESCPADEAAGAEDGKKE